MINEYRFSKDWPYHISCGGVVYRVDGDKLEIMMLVHHNGSFDIPKGTLHFNETLEACALRETEEESGQKTKLVGYLGSRLDEGTKDTRGIYISKATHYFALKWVADTGIHDSEYSHIEWTSAQNAIRKLKPSGAEIVSRLLNFMS